MSHPTPYSTLAMVTDYDCWNQSEKEVSVDLVIENLLENALLSEKIIEETAKRIRIEKPFSNSHKALKDALVTQQERVPEIAKQKISLMTKRYWKNQH